MGILAYLIDVSYTHLDVYKRQVPRKPRGRQRGERTDPGKHQKPELQGAQALLLIQRHRSLDLLRIGGGALQRLAQILVAVSYTHLDVYKRQGHEAAGNVIAGNVIGYGATSGALWIACLLYTSRCV